MPTTKIAITLEEDAVRRVDELVANHVYPSRSKAIQDAVADKLARLSRSRLAEQCALLDIDEERAVAEEFSPGELERWRRC
jgi:metal-responsive CopG/Arc/MetJ family transcriptional regulator